MAVKNLISVIVPIHNTAEYLEDCFKSLVNQTYKKLEIIAVDNGSEDDSGKICDKYVEKYEIIKVIHQKNMGVSGARNTGIRNAEGEYIAFLDSDDFMADTMLEYLYNGISGVDMSCCGYAKTDNTGKISDIIRHETKEQTMSGKDFLKILFGMSRKEYQGYIWNKLYRSSIINENKLLYDEDICYNEDRLFLCSYLVHAKKCFYSDKQLYMYRQRSDSAMGRVKDKFNENALTELYAYEKMERLLKDYPMIRSGMRVQENISARRLMEKAAGNVQAEAYIKEFMKKRNDKIGRLAVYAAKLKDTIVR